MSKFLKFIVHLVIILAVLNILALAVPPFLGINTAIIDSSDKKTNLPVGSVTYAKPVSVGELEEGDSVLIQESGSLYRYKINSIDTGTGVYSLYDQTDLEAGEKAVTLRNMAPKIIITVGFLGYLIIATQSLEGMIILGLGVLFLIILFVLAELWRKDKRIPEMGELEGGEEAGAVAASLDADNAAPKTERELKKELKARMKQEDALDRQKAKQELEEATRQLKEETKARKKEEKLKRKEAKRLARTGGFIEDYNPVEARVKEKEQTAAQSIIGHEDIAADDANMELRKEIAATTAATGIGLEATQQVVSAESKGENTEDASRVKDSESDELSFKSQGDTVLAQGVEEASAEVKEIPVELPSEEEASAGKNVIQENTSGEAAQDMENELLGEMQIPEPVVYKKMVVPVYTEEELLSKAQAAGDAPQVIRDEKTGVTLLDYSDIILEDHPVLPDADH